MNEPLKERLQWVAGPPLSALRAWRVRRGERSWSQEGEDRVLWRFCDYRRDGWYVDVGAHHPFRFSNTCLLHRAGWRGINIDAMPGSMAAFRRYRPDDVNLEVGIADAPGVARLHIFEETALNTFDDDLAADRQRDGAPLARTVDVPLRPLRDILAEHRPLGAIDLLTVDVEGRDLAVLRSNDWTRFRPAVVLAESLGQSIDDLAADPCARFMADCGYTTFAKTVNTVMYTDRPA